MKKGIVLGLGLMVLLVAGYAGASQMTFSGTNDIEDTYLVNYDGANVDGNYGGASLIKVGYKSWVGTGHGLLRFVDLSQLSGYTVTGAALRLHRYETSSQGQDATVEIYEILPANSNWVEGTGVGGTEDGASCWNYMQYTNVNWSGSVGCSTKGTDYSSTLLSSEVVTNDGEYWVEFNLPTNIVQDWVDNDTHYGLFLKVDNESVNGNMAYFRSTEMAGGNTPELVIDYIPEPSAFLLLGAGLLGLLAFGRKSKR